MESFSDGLKKVLFAGVGAVAITVDKAGELLDEMVERGESTLEQGKAINKELKRTVKKTSEEACCKDEKKDLSAVVESLSAEERAKLKELITEAENKE